ncbi:MAG: TetR/AcrR family transcriptional regulator [Pseudomonadota bacterium]
MSEATVQARRPIGRPRKFDEGVVVERAMNAFWANGYRGSSLPDLLEATELTRGSFYKAFGSKRDIFMMAFDLYFNTETKLLVDNLTNKNGACTDGLDRLTALFDDAIQRYTSGDKRGCFIYNSLAEIGDSDPGIARQIDRGVKALENAFTLAVSEARSDLEPLTPEEIKLWTANILGSFLGFKTHVRAGLDYDLKACLNLLRARLGRAD